MMLGSVHKCASLGLGFVLFGGGCSETVEQCLGLEDANAACPTAEEAEDMWRGTDTCTDPVIVVRKVVGEAERTEVHDTGVLLTPISCCYEVIGRAKQGEACVY